MCHIEKPYITYLCTVAREINSHMANALLFLLLSFICFEIVQCHKSRILTMLHLESGRFCCFAIPSCYFPWKTSVVLPAFLPHTSGIYHSQRGQWEQNIFLLSLLGSLKTLMHKAICRICDKGNQARHITWWFLYSMISLPFRRECSNFPFCHSLAERTAGESQWWGLCHHYSNIKWS